MNEPDFLERARQRKLFRWLLLYVGAAWAAAQVIEFFIDNYAWSPRVLDVALFLLAVGFFVTLTVAWFHGERGHQRVTRLESVLLGSLALVALTGSVWLSSRGAEPSLDTEAVVDLGDASVAILPFQNEVTDPELAWLDRGAAELLATHLSQIGALRVVSGQRLFDLLRQFGVEESRTVPESLERRVALRAGVRYMLTGRLAGTPGNLNLLATLADARTGEVHAGARARGADVFALIDDVSAQISANLETGTSGASLASVSELTTPDLEAYRAYEEGRQAAFRYRWNDAQEHFERAVALDSTFALAQFQLAGSRFRSGDFPAATRALAAAERHLTSASERDRLFIGGFTSFIRGRQEEGERQFARLLELYPDEKDARIIYAGFLGADTARSERVAELIEETVRLDPNYAPGWNLLAYRSAGRGDFETADSLIDRYVELEPNEPNPLDSKGEILEMAGRIPEARDAFREALRIREDFTPALQHLVRTYLDRQETAAARRELSDFRGSEFGETRVWAWWLTGDTYLWEGEIARGLAVYDSAVSIAESTGDPQLHALTVDQLIRTLILLEQYALADAWGDSLTRLRGPDGVVSAARMHRLGSENRMSELLVWRDQVLNVFRTTPGLQQFERPAALGVELLIAYYRGEHERVLALGDSLARTTTFPVEQFGYPRARAALALHRPRDLERAMAGIGATILGDGRRAPLEMRYRQYLQGRLAEMRGDSARARERYTELVEAWGDALARVPVLSDTQSRLRRLTP